MKEIKEKTALPCYRSVPKQRRPATFLSSKSTGFRQLTEGLQRLHESSMQEEDRALSRKLDNVTLPSDTWNLKLRCRYILTQWEVSTYVSRCHWATHYQFSFTALVPLVFLLFLWFQAINFEVLCKFKALVYAKRITPKGARTGLKAPRTN